MKILTLIALAPFLFFGCKVAVDTTTYTADATAESAQQVGDSMASVDESGGNSNGSIAQNEISGAMKAFARLTNEEPVRNTAIFKMAIPEAQAAACSTVTFGGCSANKKVKDFAGCTFGLAGSITGNITLNFTGSGAASCTIPLSTDSVYRVPNYTITGLRGATFTVAATSTGQQVTRQPTSGQFQFASAGIRRTFVTPKGSTVLDITTSTSSPMTVTTAGGVRANRTMTGGTLVVKNNLTNVTCNLTPTGITWGATCNCPTAGSWSGSCDDSTTFTVAFGSTCGQVTATKGTDSSTVTLDRCE